MLKVHGNLCTLLVNPETGAIATEICDRPCAYRYIQRVNLTDEPLSLEKRGYWDYDGIHHQGKPE